MDHSDCQSQIKSLEEQLNENNESNKSSMKTNKSIQESQKQMMENLERNNVRNEEKEMLIPSSSNSSFSDLTTNGKCGIIICGEIDCKEYWNDPSLKDLIKKRMNEFNNWYQEHLWNFEEYLQLFIENDLNDIRLMQDIDDEILEMIGVKKIVHRRVMLKSIRNYLNAKM